MSAITDEIIRVLQAVAPKPLTASDIYDAGQFETMQPVYVALNTMSAEMDGRLKRVKPIDSGKFAYSINGDIKAKAAPLAEKLTLDIPSFTTSAVTAAAKHNHVRSARAPGAAVDDQQQGARPLRIQVELDDLRTRLKADRERFMAQIAELDETLAAIDLLDSRVSRQGLPT